MRNVWEDAKPHNILRYLLLRNGPLSSNGGDGAAFARSRDGLPAPDLQFGCIAAPVVNQGLEPPTERRITMLVIALEPRSRGRIGLRSADPSDKAVIDPGYLSHEEDLNVLVTGIHWARAIAAASPLNTLATSEDAPGVEVADDEGLRAWIRGNVSSMFHPTSTCAMGNAQTTVCDPELRVRGVTGLRVVDASVMPTIPHGPPNAPIIALAERASDLIRGNTPLAPASP